MSESNTQPEATELFPFRVELSITVDVDAANEEEADALARFEALKQLIDELGFELRGIVDEESISAAEEPT